MTAHTGGYQGHRQYTMLPKGSRSQIQRKDCDRSSEEEGCRLLWERVKKSEQKLAGLKTRASSRQKRHYVVQRMTYNTHGWNILEHEQKRKNP